MFQKHRERSRKSFNVCQQFYYVTLNKDKPSSRQFSSIGLIEHEFDYSNSPKSSSLIILITEASE